MSNREAFASRVLGWLRYKASLKAPFLKVPRDRITLKQVQYKGATLVVLANEDVGRQVVFRGQFESEDLNVLTRFVRDGDACFDIGANVGIVAVLLAKAADDVVVHAFEPLTLNQRLIALNATLNDATVIVNGVALAATPGTAVFSESSDGAYSSLRATGRKAERRKITVPVQTIDGYTEEKAIPRIGVVKIDVEGAEEMVLQGGLSVLSDAARSPRAMMIELYDENLKPFGSSIAQVIEVLHRCGYAPYVADHGAQHFRPITPSDHNRIYNIFFLPGASVTIAPIPFGVATGESK